MRMRSMIQIWRARFASRRARPVTAKWSCLRLEALESRVVPSVTASVRTIREATGPNAAAIQATVDAFRVDLGNPNNGATVGSLGAGRREINWDGVPDADAAAGRLPVDFFNAISPRGAIFGGDPRITFQVSADAANPAATAIEFGNINATYPTAFGTFSVERLFTSLGSQIYDVTFVVPGSLNRATVSGFGAVFTDVDVAASSKIEFFDASGQEIFERTVLATPGDASLSFLGVSFVGAPVAKVRVTAGAAALGPNDVTQTGGNPDIVVVDDFLYGEPQPLKTPFVVVGADSGGPVRVLNAATGAQLTSFTPYPGFVGAVRVATGDVTGDGVPDIITAAGPGGGPHVTVRDGVTFNLIHSFFAFAPTFSGGVFVAAGNVSGDASADLIVAAGPGGGPHVKVLSGTQLNNVDPATGEIRPAANLGNFFAFAPSFSGGVTVSAGDINGEFLDDVIVGTASGNSLVKAINATQLNNVQPGGQISSAAELQSITAYPGFTGGVFVAAGDINADGRADIVTGAGPGGGPHVKAFSGINAAELFSFFAFGPQFNGGVRVGTANIDQRNAIANILTSPGPGIQGNVVLNGVPLTQLTQFLAFDPGFIGGVFVGGTR